MKYKIKVLDMIAEDMKNDAAAFDGKPFNGRTVAQYFGNQGAAIAELANLMKRFVEHSDRIKGIVFEREREDDRT